MSRNLNEEEFNKMYLANLDMVYSLGLRLFRSNEDVVSDFVQDIYLRAKRYKDSFRGDAKFSTWLYRVAMNHGLNQIKKKKELLIAPEDIQDVKVDYEQPVDSLIQKEESEIIQNELEKLPEAYRLSLVLYYFEKMSYKEISERLKIPEGTLKSYIYRGKQLLKNSLSNIATSGDF